MAKLTTAEPTDDLPAILRELLERVRRIEAAMVAGPRRMPKSSGRPPTDDADALQEIRDLMEHGSEDWAAIKSVASALGGNVKAHQKRLRRKLNDGSRP